MIFYQGKGYLVYLIPICIFILSAFLFGKNNWWYIGCIVTTILELLVAIVSYKEHKGNPYKYLDKQTNQEIFIEHKNTVYWIKAEYWALFIAIILILSALLT